MTARKLKTAFHKPDRASHFKTDRSSGNQNRGAFEAARAEIGKGLVGLLEGVARSLGDDTDVG
ncbi:hypothetical protein, partial [Bradyrhizobium sp.]|uniref:hypothetical protein n=1 Tax=Bradyrhizobium sp. TaxID=376 RepID=UPI003C6FAB11